jgi:hypothetical protein
MHEEFEVGVPGTILQAGVDQVSAATLGEVVQALACYDEIRKKSDLRIVHMSIIVFLDIF